MALATSYHLLVEQIDVISAFLQSNLNEEIYMRVPEGILAGKDQVCLLCKSLYGLKQSPPPIVGTKNFMIFLSLWVSNSQKLTIYCVYYLNSKDIVNNFFILIWVEDIFYS